MATTKSGWSEAGWGYVEASQGDAVLVASEAASTHVYIPRHVVSPLRWCICTLTNQCVRSPLTALALCCRFHHHHLDSDTFWQEDGGHGHLVARADQHDHPHLWDAWLAHVPCAATALCDEPARPCVARVACVTHPGIWVFGVHLFVRRLHAGGLTTLGEMFGLAVYFGASCT